MPLYPPVEAQLATMSLQTHSVQDPIEGECSDPSAVHDLAALSEGGLSEDGMRRLALHLYQCGACRLVFTSMVSETTRAECTDQHAIERVSALCKELDDPQQTRATSTHLDER